jgi:hypothetical protein
VRGHIFNGYFEGKEEGDFHLPFWLFLDSHHRNNQNKMNTHYPVITLETLSGALNANTDKIVLKLIGDKEDRTKSSDAVVSAEIISAHATNYRENFFDGVRVREHMLRYLHFYAIGESESPKYGEQDELSALLDANLWSERQDDEAKVAELIKYSSINKETAYIIGFIIIMCQVIPHARDNRKNLVLTIENPFEKVLRRRRFAQLVTLLIEDHSGFMKQLKETK